MRKMLLLFALFIVSYLSAGSFPNETNVVVSDLEGKSYNIDALLNEGKHILVHQMFTG